MSIKTTLGVGIEGHVRILERDPDGSNEVEVLNKRNAIHREHASILLASAIANRTSNNSIYTMHFGTGGATVDSLGSITYATPNSTGTADLNVPVYFEIVDDNNGAPSDNQMAVRHVNGTFYTDVEIRCVISQNEPFGQPAFDNTGGTAINSSNFVFDEIGLKTQAGLLITHITFSPIEKAANRIIEVVYLLRITVNQ